MGGIWLDATIFATELFRGFDERTFWSIKTREKGMFVPQGQWTGYAIGGTEKSVFRILYQLLTFYWKQHDVIVDYFLPDYLIKFLSENDASFHGLLNELSYNNEHVLVLTSLMNERFDKSTWLEINRDTMPFKLDRKKEYIDYINENCTFWHMLGEEKMQ